MRLAVSALVASALLMPVSAAAHLSATPSFLPAGGTETLRLTVHNDRAVAMTGFALRVPDGFRILGVGGDEGWEGVIEGATATWAGGRLPPLSPATFEVELEAPGTPGAVELRADQLYPDDESVRWPVALTVVPGGVAAAESASLERADLVVLGLIGLLVVGTVAFGLRRSRRSSLQER
ncbi:MAG: hypothetical protein ACRDNY_11895 [Gaiellaceae bacterium]